MTPEELARDLAEKGLRPAYLLLGEEDLLRDEALAALRHAVLGEAAPDFDLDRIDGPRVPADRVRDSLATLPVLAPRRLVVVRDPDPARSPGLDEAVASFVGDAPADPGAVLVVSARSLDGRSRLARAFGAPALRVECTAPRRPREIAAFARSEARRQGVRLSEDAALLLAERVGPELLLLRQEVAKLALLVGPGGAVGREHVAASATDIAEDRIFDLTDAIGEGRTGEALRILGRSMAAGAAPPAVLGALAAHFRRLLRVRSGGRVPGPPFVVRKLETQARRYSPARLRACLEAIHEVDEVLKGKGRISPALALEWLVVGLAG